MKRIRVLIDGMPRGILRDLIKKIAAESRDIELIEGGIDRRGLHDLVVREQPDAVILAFSEDEIPRLSSELLKESPDLVVVGIVSDGRGFTVTQSMQANSPGTRELLDSIRVAIGGGAGHARGKSASS